MSRYIVAKNFMKESSCPECGIVEEEFFALLSENARLQKAVDEAMVQLICVTSTINEDLVKMAHIAWGKTNTRIVLNALHNAINWLAANPRED